MYQIQWTLSEDFRTFDSKEVVNKKFKKMVKELKELKPDYSAFDTETDGLHIINCKPFLISFGFLNYETKKGITYTLELESPYADELLKTLYNWFRKTKKLIAYNVKFDMHMMENIEHPYLYNNITDAQIYIRLASDALSKSEGGVPTKLKDFAARYITTDAKRFEQELKEERKLKKSQLTTLLKQRLLQFGEPPIQYKVKNEKTWTKQTIDNFFKDKINSLDDLPENIREVVKEWKASTEDPDNYKYLNRNKVIKYAHYDIIYELEAFFIALPVVIFRQQLKTAKIEENAIIPLYKMERVGFKFNLQYALDSKDRLKNYIIQRRLDLCALAGCPIKSGQHAKVKEILLNLGVNIESTNKSELKNALEKIDNSYKNEKKIKEFIETLEEIRTLEKWYSTYIVKWIESLGKDGRVYTSINQTGAVSGRVSSDFQQFPSKPILDNQGNELFHPRRMIQVTGDGYDSILYIDFAAEELRFQALYTILVAGGDLNFCRAFIPLQCHTEDGTKYDTNTMAYTWFDKTWFLDENNEIWKPTDLHAQTAMSAFPDEPTDTDYFKNTLRKKYGKPTNFACVYGASINTLIHQFYFKPEMATALHTGFYKAYPKIQAYANWVNRTINTQGYVENLFGRRYYNTSGHKARNYLIQGSSADFLKIKIKEIDDFLTKNNYKSRLQMNIHDECSFEIYNGEEHIIKDLQRIMQQLDGSPIPILADLEITYTTWDEKKDLKL